MAMNAGQAILRGRGCEEVVAWLAAEPEDPHRPVSARAGGARMKSHASLSDYGD
jgi:hypothetical protein